MNKLLLLLLAFLLGAAQAISTKDLLGTWQGINAGDTSGNLIFSRFNLRSFTSVSSGGIAIMGSYSLSSSGDVLFCEYGFSNFNMSLPQSVSLTLSPLDASFSAIRLSNETLQIDITYTRQDPNMALNGVYADTASPLTISLLGNTFVGVQSPGENYGQVYIGAITFDSTVVNVTESMTTPGSGVPPGTTFLEQPYTHSPGRIDFFNKTFLTSAVSPKTSPIEGVWEVEDQGCWMTLEIEASLFRVLRTQCASGENSVFVGSAVYSDEDQSVDLAYSFAYGFSGKVIPSVMNAEGSFKYELLESGDELHVYGTFQQTQPVDITLQRAF